MPRYRRLNIEGGTFFFTVTLADRTSDLLVRHIDRLRDIYRSVQQQRPFESDAICILPDHLHAIWSLPPGDADYRYCPNKRCRRHRRCTGDPVYCHTIFWPVVPEEAKAWLRAIVESKRAGRTLSAALRAGKRAHADVLLRAKALAKLTESAAVAPHK